jgi:hypothetical protein
MRDIQPCFWNLYNMGEHGGFIVDYRCPDCRHIYHIYDVRKIAMNGVIGGGSLHCSCGFHDYIRLAGWKGTTSTQEARG